MPALTVGVNCFISIIAANEYFENSTRFAQWKAYPTDDRKRALIEGTRLIDRMCYAGEKEASPQILDFPRTGLSDCCGLAVSPERSLLIAQQATCEYAISLLAEPSLGGGVNSSGNTKKLVAGPASIEYFRPIKSGKYPVAVVDLLACFMQDRIGGSGASSVGIASGTDDCSSFTGGPFDLTKGYY